MLDQRLEDEEKENHERWLVSYADMITLLAALFIVLFAMSRVDLEKFESFAKGLREQFGGSASGAMVGTGDDVLDGTRGALEGTTLTRQQLDAARDVLDQRARDARSDERAGFAETRRAIEAQLRGLGLEGAVSFRIEERGLVVSLVTDEVLFDTGSAGLRPDGRRVLDGISPVLARLPNQLSVEGHTDDQPVRGGWGSNWELSTARATAVLRYLVEQRGVAATRLAAVGYAEQRPVVANDTTEHRAVNRRVELVVLAEHEEGAS